MHEITLPLSEGQHKFITELESPWVALLSGYGFGKTYALVIKALLLGWLNAPSQVLFMEPTYRQIKEVAVRTFREVLDKMNLGHCMRYNVNERKAYMRMNGREWEILFASYDRPDSVAGFTVGTLLCDEADYAPASVFDQATARVRCPKAKFLQRNFATTPEAYGGIIHTNFELEPLEGAKLMRAKTTDNIFVPQQYIDAQLSRYKSEAERRRYINGEYVLPGGRVYKHFDVDVHLQKWRPEVNAEWVMSCDFGKHVVSWPFVQVTNRKVHVFDEIAVENSTTMEQVPNAKSKWADILSKVYNREITGDEAASMVTVYGDPAGGPNYKNSISDFEALQQAGFRCLYRKKHRRINDRVASVNTKLAHNEMFFDGIRAPYVTKCISLQGYGQDGSPAKGRPDQGMKGLDHGADAIGYYIDYAWPVRTRKITTRHTG